MLVKDRFELPVTVGSRQSVAGAPYRQREGGVSPSGRDLHCTHSRADRRAKDAGEQDRQDAGKKDSVKRPGTADLGDRRPQPLHLAEIEEIRADQGAHGAADVSQRPRVSP